MLSKYELTIDTKNPNRIDLKVVVINAHDVISAIVAYESKYPKHRIVTMKSLFTGMVYESPRNKN